MAVLAAAGCAAAGPGDDSTQGATGTPAPGAIGSPSGVSGGAPGGAAGAVATGAAGTTPVAPPPIGSAGSMAPLAGAASMPPGAAGIAGSSGAAGMLPMAGTVSVPPVPGSGGSTIPPPAQPAHGSCCADGDCLCRSPEPMGASAFALTGPFQYESFEGVTGTIYYPTNAEPPFAGVAVCGGFTNTGLEMQGWGPFYASWGMVTIITWTGPADQPATRGRLLLGSIDELKEENEKSGSPLFGKMAERYGISGYSMGGGGTTIGCRDDPTLKSGIGLAPWSPVSGMRVPTLFLCGDADFVAGVTTPRTATGTPSLQVVFSLYSHFNWFFPDDLTGYYALAWQKTYLEGDTRWEPLLAEQISGVASMQ